MTASQLGPAAGPLRELDARGLKCPMPIVRTAQAMKELAAGELLEVVATDPGAVADFAAWSRTTGHQLLSSVSADGEFRFLLRHK
ncbi:MAG TPA: sulfurtransferase TusA family protein [Candidatus Limnocylindria bacterium]|nr:sulfurtransferase TusA family protein [Candidatus Limnocylindria bacterium]